MQTRKEKDNETGKKKQNVIFGEADQKKSNTAKYMTLREKKKLWTNFTMNRKRGKQKLRKKV